MNVNNGCSSIEGQCFIVSIESIDSIDMLLSIHAYFLFFYSIINILFFALG